MISNRISITITDAQKATVKKATDDTTAAIQTFNVVIDKDTLKSLSKLGDNRIPCVEKVAQYAVSNPEFLPPYADVAEFNRDFQTFMDARELLRPMRQNTDNLEATMMVSGSEAWEFTRNYYKTVQYQARMGVPSAQTIYDDLRALFERTAAKPEPKP